MLPTSSTCRGSGKSRDFWKISFPRPMLNVIVKIFTVEFSYIFSTSWGHKQNFLSSARRPICVSLVEIDLVQIYLKLNKWLQIHACVYMCEHLHWPTWCEFCFTEKEDRFYAVHEFLIWFVRTASLKWWTVNNAVPSDWSNNCDF